MGQMETEAKTTKLEEGFTWRSLSAIVYAAVFLAPATLYLSLVAGVGISAVYVVVILFTEIARIWGKPLKKQEVYVMYTFVGWATGITFFLGNVVFRHYFMTSPIAWSFTDPATGLPIPEVVPTWWAPTPGSVAYSVRSMLRPEWFLPIAVGISFIVFWFVAEIALTMLCAQLYIQTEPLTFPLQRMDAQVVITLSEREPYRMRVFTISAFVGLVFATLQYAIPIISLGVFGVSAYFLPIPWLDLTTSVVERIFPGGCFAIPTDLLAYATGFLLPWEVAVSMFVGSMSTSLVGNWLARTTFAPYFPEWSLEWVPGTPIMTIMQRSILWVWFSPFIGFTLAGAFLTIFKTRRYIVKSIKSLTKLSKSSREAGYLPLHVIIVMYLIGTGGPILLFLTLVPRWSGWLPLVLIPLSVGWPLISALFSTRAVGEAGYGISVPYLWNATIIATGYPYADAWFIPAGSMVAGHTAPGMVASLKVASLTNTKPSSYFKGLIFIIPVVWIMGFIYVSLFWTIAPIPSAVYPIPRISWPINIMEQSLWITKRVTSFKPNLIASSFVGMTLIGVAGGILRSYLHIPFSLIGLIVGACYSSLLFPPYTFASFLGALVGRYVLQRRFGKEWWLTYRAAIVAGVATGEGVMVGITAAAIMIAKCLWTLPY